jgi:hypothetical protein
VAQLPSGTGALNSNNNIPTTPGTYDVTFNRLTGEYAFTVSTLATGETVKKAKSFVSEGKLYTNKQGNLSVQVVDYSGRVIKTISAKATNGIELNLPKKEIIFLNLMMRSLNSPINQKKNVFIQGCFLATFFCNSTQQKILNLCQMNLGQYLYNYLQEKGSAELPGFGVLPSRKNRQL